MSKNHSRDEEHTPRLVKRKTMIKVMAVIMGLLMLVSTIAGLIAPFFM